MRGCEKFSESHVFPNAEEFLEVFEVYSHFFIVWTINQTSISFTYIRETSKATENEFHIHLRKQISINIYIFFYCYYYFFLLDVW